jgi:hypothetical protein
MKTHAKMTVTDFVGAETKINLTPLRSIIEHGGISSIVESLRRVHHEYASLSLENGISGEHVLSTVPKDLFYLKEMADAFEEISY